MTNDLFFLFDKQTQNRSLYLHKDDIFKSKTMIAIASFFVWYRYIFIYELHRVTSVIVAYCINLTNICAHAIYRKTFSHIFYFIMAENTTNPKQKRISVPVHSRSEIPFMFRSQFSTSKISPLNAHINIFISKKLLASFLCTKLNCFTMLYSLC